MPVELGEVGMGDAKSVVESSCLRNRDKDREIGLTEQCVFQSESGGGVRGRKWEVKMKGAWLLRSDSSLSLRLVHCPESLRELTHQYGFTTIISFPTFMPISFIQTFTTNSCLQLCNVRLLA